MTEEVKFGDLLNRASSALEAQWETLVRVASVAAKDGKTIDDISRAFSKQCKVGADSIKRKILAVQYVQSLGFTEDDVIAQGQEVVLSSFQQSKRTEKYETDVWLKFKVPGSQREVVQKEISRIMRVLQMNTSEQFFDWFLSQMQNVTEKELKHSAGME